MAVSPEAFAARCREIVETQSGHDAHRSLDLLTNDVLRELGFGDGVAIFEAAVSHWHEAADPYPYRGPCPDCEPAPRAQLAPRSDEKREVLTRLYLDGVCVRDIAKRIGGTSGGVRSTIRKMRERGALPPRPQPQRER